MWQIEYNCGGLFLCIIEVDFGEQILVLSVQHFAAFVDVFKICAFLHRSKLKIFYNNSHDFSKS